MFNFTDCVDKCLGQPWRFQVRAAMNWSHSFLCTPAVWYIVSWPPSTSIWIDSRPIWCCLSFLLLPVLRTIVSSASWVIFSVTTIVPLQWTNWCLRCCCVSPGRALVEAPVVRLDLAPITPGWNVSGAMTCCCRMVRKMIMKRSGKYWRFYS